MATNVSQPVGEGLFVRKASGLVKGWSSIDGFRYSFFSVNLFLGIWGFSYASWIPGGSLFWSIIILTTSSSPACSCTPVSSRRCRAPAATTCG